MSSSLWIVGFVPKKGHWEFQGVFSDEETAIAACFNERCFIAPATLDLRLPSEGVKWTGAYYPLADGRDK